MDCCGRCDVAGKVDGGDIVVLLAVVTVEAVPILLSFVDVVEVDVEVEVKVAVELNVKEAAVEVVVGGDVVADKVGVVSSGEVYLVLSTNGLEVVVSDVVYLGLVTVNGRVGVSIARTSGESRLFLCQLAPRSESRPLAANFK